MSRVQRVLTPVGGFALLLLAIAVVFFPVWNPAQRDVSGLFDAYRQFIPANYFFDASLHAGDFPTWNPLTLSGMPHAADPQVWSFYPPNLLRATLNVAPDPRSTAIGLTVLMALHLLWFGTGVFLLARRHGLSRAACAVATLGVIFSALVVRRAAEFHFVFTLAWLPWVLVLTRRTIETPEARSKFASAVLLGVALGLMVLGGAPQLVPHIAAAVLAYGVAILAVTDSGPRREWLRVAGREGAFALIALIVAIGISACSVIPASQLLEMSGRAAGPGTVAGHEPEAWNPGYVWSSLSVYSGRIYEPETVRGAGVALLALTFAGLVGGARRALPFAAILYVLVDLLIGPPMPLSLLAVVLVPFEMVSATRAFDVAVLPMGILAGYGLDAFRDERWPIRAFSAVAAAVVGLLAVWTLVTRLGDGIWLDPSRVVVYAPVLALGAAVAGAFAPRGRTVLLALVPVLVFAELWAWNRSYVSELTVRPGHQAQLDDFLAGRSGELWPDNRRGTIDIYNYNLYAMEPAINGYNPLHLERVRQVLAGPVRGREYRRAVRESEIPGANPRGHLFMKRAFWLADTAVPGPLPVPGRWFSPTRYAFLPDDLPEGFPTVGPDEVPRRPYSDELKVLRLPPPTPLDVRDAGAYRVQRYEVGPVELPRRHAVLELAYRASGAAELRSHFRFPERPRGEPGLGLGMHETGDKDRAVRIPLPDATPLRIRFETLSPVGEVPPEITQMRVVADEADEDELIEVVSRSADRVEVAVGELPAPRLLVFLDADYPGWQAHVDGEPVPIHRAQDAFKSIVVPPGEHTVVFRFRSTAVHVGVGLSLLTWVSVGVAWVVLGRARSRQGGR